MMAEIGRGPTKVEWNWPDVQRYRDDVFFAARTELNKRFPNSEIWHPTVFFAAIFQYSSKHVQILSKNLGPTDAGYRLFDDQEVIQWAVAFLSDSDSSLRILTQDSIEPSAHGLLDALSNSQQVRGELVVAKAVGRHGFARQFVVADDKSYRLAAGKGSPRSAVANFNEPDQARLLSKCFADGFEAALAASKPILARNDR